MISILQYGQNALLIQWKGNINPKIISEVSRFNQQICSSKNESILETIPAFTSITVSYKGKTFPEMKVIIENLYNERENNHIEHKKQSWQLPMLPLHDFSSSLLDDSKMSTEQFFELFFEIKFTIGMKGFLPGFMYLAGLPQNMHIPRKVKPDLSIAKGSVAIGGSQCGIYPKESPGGWHVIGNCPIPLIDINDPKLSCFKVGNEIQFKAINKSKHILYQTTDWNNDLITSNFLIHE